MPRTDLDIRLRMHYVREAQRRMPKLHQNLRQLGAVGPVVMPVPVHGASVVVKINVTHAHTTGAHLGYLQQRPKGQDGQRAVLYGPGVASRQAFVQAAHQDPRQFRLVISTPEQDGFGRAYFVERLMQQMEKDLDCPLAWIAANHYDTAHPHTHVVLRAVDGAGKEFFMSRHYFTQGFQSRAQALLNWLTREREQTEQLAATIHQVRDGVVRGTDDADGRTRQPATAAISSLDSLLTQRERLRLWRELWADSQEEPSHYRVSLSAKTQALDAQITALQDQMERQALRQPSRAQEMGY